MSPEGQRELGRNIKVNGLQTKVIVYVDADGRRSLLDGRNRLNGMEYVGLAVLKNGTLDPDIFQEIRDIDSIAYVLGANLHRRHLSTKDKRDLIGNLLRQLSDKPDRQIAAMVGCSHNTVKAVRDELIERCQIDNASTRIDEDGRRQPSRKPRKTKTRVGGDAEAKPAASDLENPGDPIGGLTCSELSRVETVFQNPNLEAAEHNDGHAAPAESNGANPAVSEQCDDGNDADRAHDLPNAPACSLAGEIVAADFNRLAPDEIKTFLATISSVQRAALKRYFRCDESSSRRSRDFAGPVLGAPGAPHAK